MIYILVTYTLKPGAATAFFEENVSSGLLAQIKAAPGNVMYEYMFAAAGGDTMYLVECWQDEESLMNHTKAAYRPMQAEIKDKHVLNTDIKILTPKA